MEKAKKLRCYRIKIDMALLQINFSCSIVNRCSKLLRCVYEIPNAFIRQISQAEPRKLASAVKPKTRRALGIAVVGFVGDHLKDKKVTEFNTLD